MATESWSTLRLLTWTEDYFRQKGIESPRLEAQILLAHVLKCDRIHLYIRTEEIQTEGTRGEFKELIKKRAEGCPVAYLVGHRDFYTRRFDVTPAVLIPRPETELLVLKALETIAKHPSPSVLDVGTGSGCIAVTIAKQLKGAKVTAIDLSEAALNVARANAVRHEVADRVIFLHGDLLNPVKGQSFDLIVSNPPYVSEAEFANLDRTVKDYEPREALLASADGLAVYRRLIPAAFAQLNSGFQLVVEIGSAQQNAVESLFTIAGFADVRTTFDDAKLARIVQGIRR